MSENKEEIVIDLSSINEVELSLIQKGGEFRRLMNVLLTGTPFPTRIIATPQQFNRFASAIGAEKEYIVAYNKHGLSNPATYRSKYRLDSAVRKFERDTGLSWPFN